MDGEICVKVAERYWHTMPTIIRIGSTAGSMHMDLQFTAWIKAVHRTFFHIQITRNPYLDG
jgi:hypothetical protein